MSTQPPVPISKETVLKMLADLQAQTEQLETERDHYKAMAEMLALSPANHVEYWRRFYTAAALQTLTQTTAWIDYYGSARAQPQPNRVKPSPLAALLAQDAVELADAVIAALKATPDPNAGQ